MSTPDPLERHFQDFGRELRLATARQRAARRMRRIGSLAGAITAAGLAAFIVTSVLPHGGVNDAVGDRASDGDIVHYVVTEASVTHTENGVVTKPDRRCSAGETEIWATTAGPPRWRSIEPAPVLRHGCGFQIGVDGRIETGQRQVATNGPRYTTYSPALRDVDIVTDVTPPQSAPTIIPTLGRVDFKDRDRDLVGSLASMLHDGRLTVTAHGEHAGRRTVTLVGKESGPIANYRGSTRTTYVVDEKTFDAIEMTYRLSLTPNGHPDDTAVDEGTVRFKVFERLPVTPENLELLKVHTGGPIRVRIHTAAEWRKIHRQEEAGPAAEAKRNARLHIQPKPLVLPTTPVKVPPATTPFPDSP
jgi:hypothetical protein